MPLPDENRVQHPRFDVLEHLGSGASGVVYHARDRESGASVALKTLRAVGPDDFYALKHEFRALAGIQHPNLVQLYELFVQGDRCFFTMEFVRGRTFLEFARGPIAARHRGVPDYARLRSGLSQLCDGLDALHHRGKLHRDVKPSNVLVDPAGRLVLLDFGFVSDLESDVSRASREAGIAGTFRYMAPELLWERQSSPAGDWFSVGVMLYECLTGEAPTDPSQPDALVRARDFVPPAPTAVAPGTPADLDAIARGLLNPNPEARASADDVRAQLPSSPRASRPIAVTVRPTEESPFIGRQRELNVLESVLKDVVNGEARLVRIVGPSGIGKTALARHFLATTGANLDALVLRAQCHPNESVPFKAIDGLIDQLGRYLARLPEAELAALTPRHADSLTRLFPVLGRAAFPVPPGRPRNSGEEEPHVIRRRAEGALRELLGRLGDSATLVLWIDDIQWGDMAGATLLQAILAGPDSPSLLLLLTYRSEDREVELLRFIEEKSGPPSRAAPEIVLEPLSRDEARKVARDHLEARGIEAENEAVGIAAESDGSPFFIGELAKRRQSHADRTGHASAPVRLEAVVRERLAELSPPERSLLSIVAVSGQPIRRSTAVRAANIGADEPRIIAKLVQESLLRLTAAGDEIALEIYHDRIREALLGQLPDEERRSCHRRLATQLEADGAAPLDVVARHLHGAGQQDQAASYAAAAAVRASAALRFAQAAELYRLALEWSPAGDLTVRSWTELRAAALVKAGHCAEAAPLFIAAAGLAKHEEALELRRLGAEQFLVSGRVDEGRAILRPLFRDLGLRYPNTLPGTLVATFFRLLGLFIHGTRMRPARSKPALDRAVRQADVTYSAVRGFIHVDSLRGGYLALVNLSAARRTGDFVRLGLALGIVGGTLLTPLGRWGTRWGRRLVASGRQLARREQNDYLDGIISIAEGTIAMAEHDWPTALASADCGIDVLRPNAQGVNWELNIGRMVALRALEEMGDFRQCASRSREFADEMRVLGDWYGALVASQYGSHATIAAADVEAARNRLRDASATWSQDGFTIQHFYSLRIEVYADVHERDFARAWQRLEDAWPALESSFLLRFFVTGLDAFALRARTGLGLASTNPDRRAALLRQVRSDLAWIERAGRGVAPTHAAALRAGIAHIEGDDQKCVSELQEAIRGYDRAQMAVYGACVRRAEGIVQGGESGRDRIARQEDGLRRAGVARPDQWAEIYVPGI